MRLIDVCVSLTVLLLLLPLFLILAILLRATGEGEILYLQERIGENEKSFNVIKFATMLKDSPNIGSGTITSKNDIRILPVGKWLRKTKINELPQFYNVLIGEMSLIGPRPHAKRDLEGVSKSNLDVILKLKPGLSGIGSIVFRNEEQILNNFDDPRTFYDYQIAPFKAELEVWYARKRSIWLNMILTIFTIYVVIFGKVNLYAYFKDLPKPSAELKRYL